MMIIKHLLTLSMLVIMTSPVYATEQQPDYIEFESEICELQTSWEYPSPLQIYFLESGEQPPFKMLHTANYRGHVASWALKGGKLFLTKVAVKENEMELNKLLPDKVLKGEIWADWFSGVILVKRGKFKKIHPNGRYSIKYKNYVFLKFKQGILANKTILSSDNYYRAVDEYFRRIDTDNPVVDGAIYEYEQSARTFREIRAKADR